MFMKYLINATTWQNGCALATISDLLIDKITTAQWENSQNLPSYQNLLQSFSYVYQRQNLTWNAVKTATKAYPHPHDQQMIWVSPLRHLLGKTLLTNHDYRDLLYPIFLTIFKRYVIDDVAITEEEYANIFLSNKSYFAMMKLEYKKYTPRVRRAKTKEFLREDGLRPYWQEFAYTKYCSALGDHRQTTPLMITAEELSFLCKALHIKLIIHTKAQTHTSSYGYLENSPLDTLHTLFSGNHWQPLVESQTKALNHKILWQHGTPRLSAYPLSYIITEVAKNFATINTVAATEYEQLNNHIANDTLDKLANHIEQAVDLFAPQSMAYNAIDTAIKKNNFSLFMTFYRYNCNARNYILAKLINDNNQALLNIILQYDAKLRLNKDGSNVWEQTLKNVLDPIHNTSLDSPLHNALRAKDITCALTLINEGANIYANNSVNITPLHLICAQNEAVVFKAIMHQDLKFEVTDCNGDTPLHYAARESAIDIFKMMAVKIWRNRFCAYKDKAGRSIVHIATCNPNDNVLKTLLDIERHRNNTGYQDDKGLTALHYAVAQNSPKKIDILTKARANILIQAKQQKPNNPRILTPLWLALELKRFDCIEPFIWHNANITATVNADGLNAIQLATKHNQVALLEKLCKRLGDTAVVNWKDLNGKYPIHSAAEYGAMESFKFLLSKGATLTVTDKEKNTPLHLAARYGHQEMVRAICESGEKHNLTLPSHIKNGIITVAKFALFPIPLSVFVTVPEKFEVNAKNTQQHTPYMLAAMHGHAGTLEVLAKHKAMVASIYSLIIDAIWHQNNALITSTDRESAVANLLMHHPALVYTNTDDKKNNLLHHCVMRLEYRMAHVLLHPITPEQRVTAFQMKNEDGLTPLDLVIKLKNSSNENNSLNKLERLFLHYDKLKYVAKFKTVKEKAEYQFQWNQDVKAELMSSGAYQSLTTAAIVVPMGVQFVAGTWAGGPWLGMEMAAAQFGSDALNTIERAFNIAAPKLSAYAPITTKVVQNGLWGLGLIRNTAKRISIEAIRQMALFPLSQIDACSLSILQKNYFYYLNAAGTLFFAAEEGLGNQLFGSYLEKYLPSIESTLKTVGVPTANEFLGMAGEMLNDGVEHLTGVNIKASVKTNYAWARENIGGLIPPTKEFQQNVEAQLMACVMVSDDAHRGTISAGAQALYVKYYGDGNLIEDKLKCLIDFANTGAITDEAIAVVHEVGILLAAQGQNYGEVVAMLSTSNALCQSFNISSEKLTSLGTQIKDAANAQHQANDSAQLKEILNTARDNAISAYAKGYATNMVTPFIHDNNAIVEKTLNALIVSTFQEGALLNDLILDYVNFLNEGTVGAHLPIAIRRIAQQLESIGENYSEVMATVVLENDFFQMFHLSPAMVGEFKENLINDINHLDPSNSEAFNAGLVSVINQTNDRARSNYLQTRPPAQEKMNDYENIMRNNRIPLTSDGFSNYASERAVSENLYQFGNLTSAEKLIMQDFLKKIYQSGQKNASKLEIDIALHNVDLVSVFLHVEPFIQSFMQGEPLSANGYLVLSQYDPVLVFAAFGAHELNVMLKNSPGYNPLNFYQTFSLYASLVQKYSTGTEKEAEQAFHNAIVDIIQQHAVDPNNYQPVGGFTIDEAANNIAAGSRNAAEIRWPGIAEGSTRLIEVDRPNFSDALKKEIKAAHNEIVTVTLSQVSLGLSTNGTQHSIGVMHQQTGQMTDIAYTFGRNNRPLFTLSNQSSHYSTFEFQELDFAQIQQLHNAVISIPPEYYEQLPTQSPVFQWFDASWERTLSNMYWSGFDNYYSQSFAADFKKYMKEFEKPKEGGRVFVNFTGDHVQVPLAPSEPVASEWQCIIDKNIPKSFGEHVLDFFIKPAYACAPVAIPLLTAMGVEVVVLRQNNTNEKDDQDNSYPFPFNLFGNSDYFGQNLNDLPDNNGNLSFPATPQGNHSTTTSVIQPGAVEFILSNPSLAGLAAPLIFSNALGNIYFKKNGNKNNDKNAGANERRHQRNPDHNHIPAPNKLPGFPDARWAKRKTPYPGGLRMRWKLSDGKILEWDYKKGEIELYTKRGLHLGAYDPNTGIQKDPPIPERRVEP